MSGSHYLGSSSLMEAAWKYGSIFLILCHQRNILRKIILFLIKHISEDQDQDKQFSFNRFIGSKCFSLPSYL